MEIIGLWFNMGFLVNKIFDSGSLISLKVDSINFDNNLSVSDNGNGAITVNAVSGSQPNLWETITGDTGSTTADTTTDILNINGGTAISTSVSGDTLTINNDAPNIPLAVTEDGTTIQASTTTINFTGNVEVIDDGNGQITASVGTGLNTLGLLSHFHFSGAGKDTWGFSYAQSDSSASGPDNNTDSIPLVAAFDMTAVALYFSNKNNGTNTDIEIYANGVLQFTWQIRDKKYAYKTNGLSGLTFNAGDTISAFFSDAAGGNDLDSGYVHIAAKITDSSTGEGGSSTL